MWRAEWSLGRLSWICGVFVACAMCSAGASTDAARANCTGTVLEWNVGIVAYFSEDQPASGQNFFIPPLVFLDLDFQSTWNQSLQTRWGAPYWAGSVDLNPCLKIRPVFVDGQGYKKLNFMRAQVNSIWLHEDHAVDVFVYAPEVPSAVVLHSSSIGKLSVGMMSGTAFENKQDYPYFFRYSPSSAAFARAMFRYFEYFAWRALVYMYDENENSKGKFQIFMGLWDATNRSSDLLQLHNLPSGQPPYRQYTINNIITSIRTGTVRLIFADFFNDYTFATDSHCQPYPFNGCVVADMMRAGAWAPKFQLLVDTITEELKWTVFPHDWAYTSTLHFVSEIPGRTHGLFMRWPALFGTIAQRLKPTDYANAYTRYGIDKWENNNWKTKWENQFVQGQIFSGMMPFIFWRYAGWMSDAFAFVAFGLNHVMDTYQPLSKSEITSKQLADSMSVAAPPWTVYGGTVPLTMPYPKQEADFGTVILQDYWDPDALFNYKGINPDPICCKATYPGMVSLSGIPRWAPGNASKIPPPALLNCTPGQFKQLPSGLCEWCQPGRFSNTIDQTACELCPKGKRSAMKAEKCIECEAGKVAIDKQSEVCTDCTKGYYAPTSGMALCEICELGSYSDARAATTCNSCGGDLTTEMRGSITSTDCVCPLGFFSRKSLRPNSSNGIVSTACEKCMDGLDCKTSWPSSWNAIGSLPSISTPGYYTLSTAPYDPYKCCSEESCMEDCPGGPPESCSDGREGLMCNGCSLDGHYISGKACVECSPLLKLLVPTILLVSGLGCLFAYYMANGRLSVNSDNLLAFFLFVGLVVTAAQILGVIKNLSIPWPKSINGIMTGSSAVFALDATSIPIECAVGASAMASYCAQALLPYILLSEVCLLSLGSKLVAVAVKRPSIAWETNKSLNVAGQLMQALFIAFCIIMLKPFNCYDHPNGKKSMAIYPQVLCYEGGDHSRLIILAVFIACGFLLPFVTWCVWGCLKAPHESSINNVGFLQRYRFLLYRFRPDFWWWGLCFLSRQTILAFAIVLPVDNPHAQLLYTGGILAIYGFLVCRFWPWISKELSAIDAGTMLILVLLMLAAAQFLPEPQPSKGRVGSIACLFVCMALLFARYIVLVIKSVCARGILGEFESCSPDRMTLSQMWLQWLEYSHNVPNSDIVEAVCRMNAFDRKVLLNFITSWNAVTGHGVEGSKWRLRGVPSRTRVNKDSAGELARSSSRISTKDFGESILSSIDDNSQRNASLPRILGVIASAGTGPNCGDKSDTSFQTRPGGCHESETV